MRFGICGNSFDEDVIGSNILHVCNTFLTEGTLSPHNSSVASTDEFQQSLPKNQTISPAERPPQLTKFSSVDPTEQATNRLLPDSTCETIDSSDGYPSDMDGSKFCLTKNAFQN